MTLENTDYFPLPAKSAGLWCYTTLGGSSYSTVNDTVQFDSKFDAARGCGTATLILGIVVWLFYCFAGCCPFTTTTFRIVAFLCICNTIFQGLVFLVLRSEICWQGCGLDTAGYCAIAACVLWFLAGILSCMAGKPVLEEEIIEDEEGSDDEESREKDEEASRQEDEIDEEDVEEKPPAETDGEGEQKEEDTGNQDR